MKYIWLTIVFSLFCRFAYSDFSESFYLGLMDKFVNGYQLNENINLKRDMRKIAEQRLDKISLGRNFRTVPSRCLNVDPIVFDSSLLLQLLMPTEGYVIDDYFKDAFCKYVEIIQIMFVLSANIFLGNSVYYTAEYVFSLNLASVLEDEVFKYCLDELWKRYSSLKYNELFLLEEKKCHEFLIKVLL